VIRIKEKEIDGIWADFYRTIAPWTEAFVVSSCGKILPLLQPAGGCKKRIDRLY